MGDGLLVTLRLKLIVLVSNIVQIINGSRQVYWMLRFFVLAQFCVGLKDFRLQQPSRIGICQYMVMAQIEQQLILTLKRSTSGAMSAPPSKLNRVLALCSQIALTSSMDISHSLIGMLELSNSL